MTVANLRNRVAEEKGISNWWVAAIFFWVGLIILALLAAPWKGERTTVFNSPQYQNKTVYLLDRDQLKTLWVVAQSTPEKEILLELDPDHLNLRVWQPAETGSSESKTLTSFHLWSNRLIDEVSYNSNDGITVRTGRNFAAFAIVVVVWVIYSFVLVMARFLLREEEKTRKRYGR